MSPDLKKKSVYSDDYWERCVKDFTLWLWVDWSIYFPMQFCHFLLFDFEIVFLGAYKSKIVIYFWWFEPFLIMKCSYLP